MKNLPRIRQIQNTSTIRLEHTQSLSTFCHQNYVKSTSMCAVTRCVDKKERQTRTGFRNARIDVISNGKETFNVKIRKEHAETREREIMLKKGMRKSGDNKRHLT